MKSFSLLLAAVSLLGVSCERHEFEGPNGTKQLHQPHGGGHHEVEEHGADHAVNDKVRKDMMSMPWNGERIDDSKKEH